MAQPLLLANLSIARLNREPVGSEGQRSHWWKVGNKPLVQASYDFRYAEMEQGRLMDGPAEHQKTGSYIDQCRTRIAAVRQMQERFPPPNGVLGLRYRWDYCTQQTIWVPDHWMVPNFTYYGGDNAIDPRVSWGWAAWVAVEQARYVGADFLSWGWKADLDPSLYQHGQRPWQPPPWSMDSWVWACRSFLEAIIEAAPDLTLIVGYPEGHPIAEGLPLVRGVGA